MQVQQKKENKIGASVTLSELYGGDMPFQSQEGFLKQEELIKRFGESNAYLLWSLSMHHQDQEK
jgi:hypothetical protein